MKTVRNSALLAGVLVMLGSIPSFAKFGAEGSAYPVNYLNRQLTAILVNDNFSPPVASRVYAYTSISAYTALAESAKKDNKLRSALIDYPRFLGSGSITEYSPSLVSSFTFYYLSKKLIYTFQPFDDSFKVLLNWYRAQGCSETEIDNSGKIAKGYADQFIAWTGKDNFAETRRMSEYVLDEITGHWSPTYPGYMPALEPHWGKMRRLLADTGRVDCSKFVALDYDTASGSKLYQEAMKVYRKSKDATAEELGIADFWDCNAFAIFPEGHTNNIVKKMSPGGHWMNIVRIVSNSSGADIYKTGLAYALTSAALYEAFICTWRLKYVYKTCRPETYIQNPQGGAGISDPEFRPYLQSPPFPEYPSGHALISMAAATVLTSVFGESYQFTDNTEDAWGIPARKFASFKDAAVEAGISRFYGLIHYEYSCTDGNKIGALIGDAILANMK